MWYKDLKDIGVEILSLHDEMIADDKVLFNFMNSCRTGTLRPIENSIFEAVEKYVGAGFIINVPISLDVRMYRKPLYEINRLFFCFHNFDHSRNMDLSFPQTWTGSYLQYFPATEEVIAAAKNVKVSMKNKNELEATIRISIISELNRIQKNYEPYLERLKSLIPFNEMVLGDQQPRDVFLNIVDETKQWEPDVYFKLNVAVPSCYDYEICRSVFRLCPSSKDASEIVHAYQVLDKIRGTTRRNPFKFHYLELVPPTEALLDLLKSDVAPEKETFIRELDCAVSIFFGLDIVYTKSSNKV